jgi:hypothetical protein
LYATRAISTVLPGATFAPFPVVTSVRCVDVALSGVANVTVGAARKAPVTVMDFEVDPDGVFAQAAAVLVDVEPVGEEAELQAARASTAPMARETRRGLRTTPLSRKEQKLPVCLMILWSS